MLNDLLSLGRIISARKIINNMVAANDPHVALEASHIPSMNDDELLKLYNSLVDIGAIKE